MLKKKFDICFQNWYQTRLLNIRDPWAVSSTRQSTWLLISRLKVRFLHGPPVKSRLSVICAESLFYWISSNLVKLEIIAPKMHPTTWPNLCKKNGTYCSQLVCLSLNPPHNQRHQKINFSLTQRPALLYSMPFWNTTPATGSGWMLCYEDRMVFHRCLFAVIFRKSGRDSGNYKLKGMFLDSFETFGGDVISIFLG